MRLAWVVVVAACKAGAPGATSGSGSAELALPPDPTVLATDQPSPSAIVSDGSYLYWNHWGAASVRRMPIAGGPVTTVCEPKDELGGRSLAIVGDKVIFDTTFNIWSCPTSGGEPTILGHVSQMPMRMTADATGAYFEDDQIGGFVGGKLLSYGSSYETWDIAVDATHIYWISRSGVWRVAKTGGKPQMLANGEFRFARIALSDTDVYFGDGVLESIFAVPKSGGKVRFIAHAWSMADQALVASGGTLWKISASGVLSHVDNGKVTSIAFALTRGGVSDHTFGILPTKDFVYVAAGGETVEGTGIRVIDLTGNPNAPPPPKSHYSGEILRVVAQPVAGAVVTDESLPLLANVWFKGTTTEMQDPGNAVRWIDQQAISADVRSGKLAVRVIGRGEAPLALARADAVAAAIRDKLPGAKLAPSTTLEPGYGDVMIAIDPDELAAAMAPQSERK